MAKLLVISGAGSKTNVFWVLSLPVAVRKTWDGGYRDCYQKQYG
jgi:hypothetical protein